MYEKHGRQPPVDAEMFCHFGKFGFAGTGKNPHKSRLARLTANAFAPARGNEGSNKTGIPPVCRDLLDEGYDGQSRQFRAVKQQFTYRGSLPQREASRTITLGVRCAPALRSSSPISSRPPISASAAATGADTVSRTAMAARTSGHPRPARSIRSVSVRKVNAIRRSRLCRRRSSVSARMTGAAPWHRRQEFRPATADLGRHIVEKKGCGQIKLPPRLTEETERLRQKGAAPAQSGFGSWSCPTDAGKFRKSTACPEY